MEKKNAMGKKVFRFFKIWGNIILGAITIYPFIVTYLIPSKAQQGELTSLFGWPWHTWLIILLVSIILTLLTQNWIEKFDKENNTLSTITSANHEGVAMQGVNNSPVIQASGGGVASVGDMYLTQNFFPLNKPEVVSFVTTDGQIDIRHNGNDSEFKFTIINETKDLPKCAVYIDEIAYKTQKDKQWTTINDLPSSKPLKWDTLFIDLEGKVGIENGDRKAFILLERTQKYSKERVVYQYSLIFHKEKVLLPHGDATSHRILMRFYGGQYFGGGINKKFYIYLNEDESGLKKYVGVKEFRGEA